MSKGKGLILSSSARRFLSWMSLLIFWPGIVRISFYWVGCSARFLNLCLVMWVDVFTHLKSGRSLRIYSSLNQRPELWIFDFNYKLWKREICLLMSIFSKWDTLLMSWMEIQGSYFELKCSDILENSVGFEFLQFTIPRFQVLHIIKMQHYLFIYVLVNT